MDQAPVGQASDSLPPSRVHASERPPVPFSCLPLSGEWDPFLVPMVGLELEAGSGGQAQGCPLFSPEPFLASCVPELELHVGPMLHLHKGHGEAHPMLGDTLH